MRFTPVLAVTLAACGALQQAPPPDAKVIYRDVPVPTPVPCFSEADRPIPPEPTPIDLDNATTDQMADAVAADNIAEARYMVQLEALFIQCQKSQGKEVK